MFQGNYFLNKLNWEKNIQKILKKRKNILDKILF